MLKLGQYLTRFQSPIIAALALLGAYLAWCAAASLYDTLNSGEFVVRTITVIWLGSSLRTFADMLTLIYGAAVAVALMNFRRLPARSRAIVFLPLTYLIGLGHNVSMVFFEGFFLDDSVLGYVALWFVEQTARNGWLIGSRFGVIAWAAHGALLMMMAVALTRVSGHLGASAATVTAEIAIDRVGEGPQDTSRTKFSPAS